MISQEVKDVVAVEVVGRQGDQSFSCPLFLLIRFLSKELLHFHVDKVGGGNGFFEKVDKFDDGYYFFGYLFVVGGAFCLVVSVFGFGLLNLLLNLLLYLLLYLLFNLLLLFLWVSSVPACPDV